MTTHLKKPRVSSMSPVSSKNKSIPAVSCKTLNPNIFEEKQAAIQIYQTTRNVGFHYTNAIWINKSHIDYLLYAWSHAPERNTLYIRMNTAPRHFLPFIWPHILIFIVSLGISALIFFTSNVNFDVYLFCVLFKFWRCRVSGFRGHLQEHMLDMTCWTFERFVSGNDRELNSCLAQIAPFNLRFDRILPPARGGVILRWPKFVEIHLKSL